MLRLDPPIWLETPNGRALAHFIVDRGIEFDNEWVCVHADGAVISWMNPVIRVSSNFTLGRHTMPLVKSKSKKAFSTNVKREMGSGRPQKQALAIAYSVKRKSSGKKKK